MTEIQAINELDYLLGYENAIDKGYIEEENHLNSEEKEALKFILDEIRQYRAIGTVEEITNLIKFLSFDDDTSILEDLRMLVEYYAIGTVEEFKALKEKNEPKKIKGIRFTEAICPSCESELFETYWAFGGIHYCNECGQEIDWD